MQTKRPLLALSGLAGVVLLATTLVGCGNLPDKGATGDTGQQPGSTSSPSSKNGGTATTTTPPAPEPVVLTPSVKDHAKGVKVSTLVKVHATAGTLTKVKVWTKSNDHKIVVPGKMATDSSLWKASKALDPSSTYHVTMTGKNASDQAAVTTKSSFKTQKLGSNEQTYASIIPAKGSTVGVGMPVIINFDVAVKDRANFQKHLSVSSTGNQEGSWSWYGPKSVHFRPKVYWKPGTKVKVTADLNGVKAGGGVYGQRSVSTSFKVGRSFITKVNLKSDYAHVYKNGKKVKTIAVTGGKPGWRTRSGVKLIMGKEYNKVMTNEAIGAKEKYRLTAKYAMRITNSGEFLHSAPWSISNQGVRNASHGCTGMSIANSHWLYERVLLGDPVVTTGTKRHIERGNGWTDWNVSYKEYKKYSAL